MEVEHCKAQHEVLLTFIRYSLHFWGPWDQPPLSYWIDRAVNPANHPSQMNLSPELKLVLARATVLSEECCTPLPPPIAALRFADRSQAFTDILKEIHWCVSVVFHGRICRHLKTSSALELNEFPWDAKVGPHEQVLLKGAEEEDWQDLMLKLEDWHRDHECSVEECGCMHGPKDPLFCLAAQIIREWSGQASRRYDSDHLSTLWSFDDEVVNRGRLIGSGSLAAVMQSSWLGIAYAEKFFGQYGLPSLRAEAEALAKLNNPHIVRVYACSEKSLLLDLMSSDLRKFMNARMRGRARDQPSSLSAAIDLMLQIGDAMSYVHSQRMAYRDLKSSNILVNPVIAPGVDPEDGYVFAKLADFGFAKVKDEITSYSHLTHNVGTRRWMAPEIFGANKDDDHLEHAYPMKADVYSFGIVCFEILTGEEPYNDVPLSSLYSKLTGSFPLRPQLPLSCPKALESLIGSCWHADPRERPTFTNVCRMLRFLKGIQTMEYLGYSSWNPIDGIRPFGRLRILKEVEGSWVAYKGDQQALLGPTPKCTTLKYIQLGPFLGIDCGIHSDLGKRVDVKLQQPHHGETPRNEVEKLKTHTSLNSSYSYQDEHGGHNKLEAELHVIDMLYANIPLDFEATRFEVIMECFIASVQGVEAQVAKFSQLHLGKHIPVFKHIQVFNQECDSLVENLAGTIHDRLRRYNITLSVVPVAGVSDRRRLFMTVAFCIVALAELERMFKAVLDLLTMCSKQDWWNTALELSNALPSRTIPRSSSFSLAIRSCEWSMDIVDFGFHALQQCLAGASTVTGVVFKWSDKQSRMVLHIDGKPLYHDVGGSSLLDEGGSSLLDVTRDLEGKDVTALIQKLVELNETRKRTLLKRFSKADANMHSIADVLSQKLHGPRPEPNSVPYTFRVNPSTLKIQKVIGWGGFGCVAECKWLGQKVSVKTVKMPGLSRKQFEMEAAILATVQHPRVVRMIGCAFDEKTGTGSLVMELMEGDLRHVIEERCPTPARGVSPFPLRVAIDIMLQIVEGMQYLREHRILHRDLKGKNVLLNKCLTSECGAYRKLPDLAALVDTEEYYNVKLADFGIAKASRALTNFVTRMAGTTSWMAPEVHKVPGVETVHDYEWPADVYSFAMTCYEILTGCTPFNEVPNAAELYQRIVDGERPPLDDVKIPSSLRDLVERCWKTDPNERPNFNEICKTLWQCKVENILPAFRLQMDPSQAESV